MACNVNLKTKYFLFIIILHLVVTFLIFTLLKDKKILFILSEVFIILSLFLSYALYKALIRPIDLMQTGVNALKDEDFNVKFIRTGSKEIDKLIDLFNRLIDRLRIEKTRMEEQNYFLENLMKASPSGIIILDYDHKIAEMNAKAIKFTKIQGNWKNKSLSDLDSPILEEIDKLKSGDSKMLTWQGVEKYRCQVSHFIHKGFGRKFVLIEEMSNELLEAEKQAYGKVIRMMAHEVNNSIGAVNSILQTVEQYAFPNPKENQDLKKSLAVAIDRNKMLNQFMRNFADVIRLPEPNKQRIDINETLRKTIQLMRVQFENENIKWQSNLSPKPLFIHADAIQMEQVFVNIIKNSLEAIKDEGIIKISTTQNPICIKIEDSGEGITAETQAQLFSPFFSTKPTGQGIGLIVIREILLNHGMTFSLSSDTQKSLTTFQINILNE